MGRAWISVMRDRPASTPATRNRGWAMLRSRCSVSASRIVTTGVAASWACAGFGAKKGGASQGGTRKGTRDSSMTSSAENRASGFRMASCLARPAAVRTGSVWRLALLAVAMALPGCGTLDRALAPIMGSGPQPGQPGYVRGFLGGVVADEPDAALAGREVLSRGGNAADAAVAVGVRPGGDPAVPCRAGRRRRLPGLCAAASSVNRGVPEAVLFVPGAPPQPPERSRPAGGAADAGARHVPAARPLRQTAVRKPDRRRPSGRRASACRCRGRWRGTWRRWPARCSPIRRRARCSRQDGVPLSGRTEAGAARAGDHPGGAARCRGGRLLPGRAGAAAWRNSPLAGGSADRDGPARRAAEAGGAADRGRAATTGGVPAAAGGWRTGRRGGVRIAAAEPAPTWRRRARALAVAARWRAGRRHGGGAAACAAACRGWARRHCRPPPALPRWTATAMRWSAR